MTEINLILSSTFAKKQKQNYNQEAHDFTIHFYNPIQLNPNREYRMALKEITEMAYSWHNITMEYGNNKMKYREKGSDEWTEINFPDGNYSYSDLNEQIRSYMEDITLEFDMAQLRVEIIMPKDYSLDFSSGEFHKLIGFGKRVYTQVDAVDIDDGNYEYASPQTPNITNGVDLICIHTDLTSRNVTDMRGDLLFCFSVISRGISRSYPIHIEPIWPSYIPVNKSIINSIRVYITDAYGRTIKFNGTENSILVTISDKLYN